MRLAEHEWFVLFFACAASLLWLCLAFVLFWDQPLLIAADDPGSWARGVLVLPLWAAVALGSWLYANGVGTNPLALGLAVGLLFGMPLGLFAIAWLRRAGV